MEGLSAAAVTPGVPAAFRPEAITTTQQWQTAGNLLHISVDLPGQERAAWIHQASGGDAVLTADVSPANEIRQAVRFAVRQGMVEK